MGIFEITEENITRLGAMELTRLLRRLLYLEAKSHGIPSTSVQVGLDINAPDGGEDGRISWTGDPERTDFLPSQFVQFQVKATDMEPQDCADEIVGSDGSLKPMIQEALLQGATYALFNSRRLNRQKKQRRVTKIRDKLREKGLANANTCRIEIYDAERIAEWTNQYLPAIIEVSNLSRRPIIHGLKTYDEWRGSHLSILEYVPDEDRQKKAEQVKAILQSPRSVVRIIGASGLGKTRFALEACKELDEAHQDIVYLDAANDVPNLVGEVVEWVRRGLSGTLVVDNCELRLHEQLKQEVMQESSKLNLLTIHYSLNRGSDTNLIELSKMQNDFIKQMLEQVYRNQLQDINRIVDFAKGFPQMAVLLAESRFNIDSTQNMGSLTDDNLLKKMLWGDDPPNDEKRRILAACSLFDTFGFEDAFEDEAKFIAEEIAHVSIDDLHRCIMEFERKRLVNRHGRYVQIVPIPVATRLAEDWWKATRKETQVNLIQRDMPRGLYESFCDQIERLDLSPEVKEFTEDLYRESTDSFGEAGVILSEKGSWLFRSLVVVNPKATSSALTRTFSQLKKGEFLNIKGDIRRNLVRALGRLCFHKETFLESVHNLCLLAREENESWSNNASGLFIHLFSTFSSATEAEPEIKLQYIDELIQGDETQVKLAIKALENALNRMGSMRVIGVEYQGSGAPLKDWQPKIWQEVYDYWVACIARLTRLTLAGNEEAKSTLAANIRSMVTARKDTLQAYDRAIREIVEAQGPLWTKAVHSIKEALRYDANGLPNKAVDVIRQWLDLLQPQNIKDRLKLLVTDPGHDLEKDNNDKYVDHAQVNAIKLGEDLANPLQIEDHHIRQLLEGDQRQAFAFGRAIYKATNRKDDLLDKVLRQLPSLESPNARLFYGMLCEVHAIYPDQWEGITDMLQQPEYAHFYINATTTGQVSDKHLNTIIGLRKQGFITPTDVSILEYGRSLDHLESKVVADFALSLTQISQDDAWVALSIINMYCYGKEGKWQEIRGATKQMLLQLNLNKENLTTMYGHNWEVAAENTLREEDTEFSKLLCEVILESVHDMDYTFKVFHLPPVLSKIFGMHGKEVWSIFGDALKNADAMQEYHIIGILYRERINTDKNKKKELLDFLPKDVLEDWCVDQPDLAPEIIAQATDWYQMDGENPMFSDRIIFLLDKYGDRKDVLSNISANMDTYTVCGSLINLYELRIAVLSKVANHPREQVREWAHKEIEYCNRRIEAERIHDEELYIR